MFNSRPFRSTVRPSGAAVIQEAAKYSPSQEAVRRQHPKYSFADNVQAMMAMYQGYGLVGHGGSAWNWGNTMEYGIPSGNLLQFAIENGHW